jgi:uncharacterized protein
MAAVTTAGQIGYNKTMPTNLPPEYFAAEERYKAAQTPEERIKTLEELISTVPKHKGTDHLRADLRRRLARLKETAQARKKTTRHESAFQIPREGAGQVAVIGPANVGKSALVTALTNASPEVAGHPFTTWTPTPGMMDVGRVQIQLIDTPPLDRDYVEPELLALIRRADLLLLVVDLETYPIEQVRAALDILAENRIVPEQMRPDPSGGSGDGRPADRYAPRIIYIPLMVAANKGDDDTADEIFELFCALFGEKEWPCLPVSAVSGRNLDRLRQQVFEALRLMRVYARPPGQEPDYGAPFVLPAGATVEEFAAKVHRDFVENLKSARVWGTGVFDGQLVGRDHVLHEGDVVELKI